MSGLQHQQKLATLGSTNRRISNLRRFVARAVLCAQLNRHATSAHGMAVSYVTDGVDRAVRINAPRATANRDRAETRSRSWIVCLPTALCQAQAHHFPRQ